MADDDGEGAAAAAADTMTEPARRGIKNETNRHHQSRIQKNPRERNRHQNFFNPDFVTQ